MIRRASVADLDAVMAVEQASFDPPWSRASWAEEIAAADHRLTLVAVSYTHLTLPTIYSV